MKMSEKIILSLGSNVGNRQINLEKAIESLKDRGFEIDKISNVYETEPVGFKDQDSFYNMAVSGYFNGEPEELLKAINGIEADLGRKRVLKYGPRTIDIDIIMFGKRKVNSDKLTIPHPEYKNRKFVLIPAAEIEPEEAADALKECTDDSFVRKVNAERNEV